MIINSDFPQVIWRSSKDFVNLHFVSIVLIIDLDAMFRFIPVFIGPYLNFDVVYFLISANYSNDMCPISFEVYIFYSVKYIIEYLPLNGHK